MATNFEKHLILNKYFLNLFGFDDFNSLREKTKDISIGYNNEGRSFFVDTLIGFKPELENLLLRYDEAIKEYTQKLSKNRLQNNFSLKYFQYLAVLFTEFFLDKYFNEKERLLTELNNYLEQFNQENKTEIKEFTEQDLKKLAFWMATGSGKTLIMHINYWQILKYFNKWDNILLITPNEGLSKQHYEELKLSGIPCKLYEGNIDNAKTNQNEILIIDIHKLTKEKKGKGVRVDISFFDGRNLVFIDEGHKGQKSEEQTWKKLRETIAKDGFLTEYSATFGQIIGKNKDLLEEYAKAIIFDYSYKYFYTDGYGKDFYVFNIQGEKQGKKQVFSATQQRFLLTASLLSFYQQLWAFDKNKQDLRKYNIEKPLWIFVGSKVTGKGLNSDVVKVVQFLNTILQNEDDLKQDIEKILNEDTGLIDDQGNDAFKGKFELIKSIDLQELINDIYTKVFGGKGNLELFEIKNANGEIGLKTTTAEKYFGVINVGDVSALKKLIQNLSIEVKTDNFTQSLFDELNNTNSQINILIGSKKFIEGWNSWRVSSMGLINMGKGEGPQIIQLFGRGVRLKGKNFSLKREENPNLELKVLQTLQIFGLNADYINAFLEAITKEEVNFKEIEVSITFNKKEDWEDKLYTIKTDEQFDFTKKIITLELDMDILNKIKIDLRPKITYAHGLETQTIDINEQSNITIPNGYLEILDWEEIFLELNEYRLLMDMYNLVLDEKVIRDIILNNSIKIYLTETEYFDIQNNTLRLKTFAGLEKLQELITSILKSYIHKFYTKKRRQEEQKYLKAEPLNIETHSNMFPQDYTITIHVPSDLVKDLETIKNQLEQYNNGNIPDEWDNEKLKSIFLHFGNHLYTPLIIWQKNKDKIKSFPVKLNEGETKFVLDLKIFIASNYLSLKNKEIYLLRNLSKKGIGFFVNNGFYPDFILWIYDTQTKKQKIIFIDPKGIRNLGNFNDDKIQLCVSYIKEIEKKVKEELKRKGQPVNLILDAFIISVSSYDDIKTTFGEGNYKKEEFEKRNILFQEDNDYIMKIFKKVGVIKK